MSDLDIWIAHFTKFGVKFTQEPTDDTGVFLITDEGNGYNGFKMVIRFYADGSFHSYGVWE